MRKHTIRENSKFSVYFQQPLFGGGCWNPKKFQNYVSFPHNMCLSAFENSSKIRVLGGGGEAVHIEYPDW